MPNNLKQQLQVKQLVSLDFYVTTYGNIKFYFFIKNLVKFSFRSLSDSKFSKGYIKVFNIMLVDWVLTVKDNKPKLYLSRY